MLLVFAAALLVCAVQAEAQNIAFNGDFETADYNHGWTLTGAGGDAEVVVFDTVMGEQSLCLRRCPGEPSNNGGFEQEVHLLGGVTYDFSADIAAAESG
jgi:hypothetical protein